GGPDMGPGLRRGRLAAALKAGPGRAPPRIQAAPEIARREARADPRGEAPRIARPEPPLHLEVGIAPTRAALGVRPADDVDVVGRTDDQIDRTGDPVAELRSELKAADRHALGVRARVLGSQLELEAAVALGVGVVGDERMCGAYNLRNADERAEGDGSCAKRAAHCAPLEPV